MVGLLSKLGFVMSRGRVYAPSRYEHENAFAPENGKRLAGLSNYTPLILKRGKKDTRSGLFRRLGLVRSLGEGYRPLGPLRYSEEAFLEEEPTEVPIEVPDEVISLTEEVPVFTGPEVELEEPVFTLKDYIQEGPEEGPKVGIPDRGSEVIDVGYEVIGKNNIGKNKEEPVRTGKVDGHLEDIIAPEVSKPKSRNIINVDYMEGVYRIDCSFGGSPLEADKKYIQFLEFYKEYNKILPMTRNLSSVKRQEDGSISLSLVGRILDFDKFQELSDRIDMCRVSKGKSTENYKNINNGGK